MNSCSMLVKWMAVMALLIVALTMTVRAQKAQPPQLLYVWAGEVTGQSEDIVAVYDLTERSPRFGKLLNVVKLKGRSAKGNEPHHAAFSADKRVFAAGGLLSLLKPGQATNDELFYFSSGDSLMEAMNPLQLQVDESAANPPLSAVSDEFIALQTDGFAISMMGKFTGMCPGRIIEVNSKLELVGEYPAANEIIEDPECFCPHGLSVDEKRGIAISGDFVVPASILPSQPGPHFCQTFRIWDWNTRKIVRTVRVPNSFGFMNTVLIPRDPQARAFAIPMVNNTVQVHLIDTSTGAYKNVLDLPDAGSSFTFMRMTSNGKRMFIAANTVGKVYVINTADPNKPKLIQTVSLPNSGVHYVRLDRTERLVLVSGYFLNAGKVVMDGDHKVHVFRNGARKITPITTLNLDTAVEGRQYRPHGFDFWWQ